MFKVVATMATGEVRLVAKGIFEYNDAMEMGKEFMRKHGLKVKSIKVERDEGAKDEKRDG